MEPKITYIELDEMNIGYYTGADWNGYQTYSFICIIEKVFWDGKLPNPPRQVAAAGA